MNNLWWKNIVEGLNINVAQIWRFKALFRLEYSLKSYNIKICIVKKLQI